MKNTHKHILCLTVAILFFAIGACHKDLPKKAAAASGNADSIHLADSIYHVDSIARADSIIRADSITNAQSNPITSAINCAVGTYACQLSTHYLRNGVYRDSLAGYDTIHITRGPGSTQITVNGEVFTYDTHGGATVPFLNVYDNGPPPILTNYLTFGTQCNTVTYDQNSHYSAGTPNGDISSNGTKVP